MFGETALINVEIDNSNCDKNVKEVKFKLVCKFTVRTVVDPARQKYKNVCPI
jgi:hypothetical protein